MDAFSPQDRLINKFHNPQAIYLHTLPVNQRVTYLTVVGLRFH